LTAARAARQTASVGELGAFLGISILVIVTPGPDTALTIRNTLLGGRRGGILTAAGVAIGQAIWTVATSLGVAAILVASTRAFEAVKLVGAAYLVFLGLQAIRAGWRRLAPAAGLGAGAPRAPAGTTALRQGVLNNLGNPKMAVFFTSLLPQFAPGGGASLTGLVLLGLCFCGLTLAWLTGYAVVVARAGDVLRRPAIRRVVEGVTGAVLVALGLRLAMERR